MVSVFVSHQPWLNFMTCPHAYVSLISVTVPADTRKMLSHGRTNKPTGSSCRCREDRCGREEWLQGLHMSALQSPCTCMPQGTSKRAEDTAGKSIHKLALSREHGTGHAASGASGACQAYIWAVKWMPVEMDARCLQASSSGFCIKRYEADGTITSTVVLLLLHLCAGERP